MHIEVEIKQIHHPYDSSDLYQGEIVLILGFFDGVHRGHQEVIKKGIAIAKERKLKAAVMTFTRHPGIVYRSVDMLDYAYLTPLARKEQLMESFGVDILYEVNFTSSFGALSPQAFVDQYIIGWNAQVVVAGFDYTYGEKDQANMETLPDYAKGRFEIVKVPRKEEGQQKISSTRIRQVIAEGKIDEANELLGYIYETSGFVIHGDARGRTIGFPTANIFVEPHTVIPRRGVYAVKICIDGKWYNGMASIGYNVTFERRRRYSVEVHIFDFKHEIYGENVRVKWVHYLREEVKFNSAEELIQQLNQDELDSREILADRAGDLLI